MWRERSRRCVFITYKFLYAGNSICYTWPVQCRVILQGQNSSLRSSSKCLVSNPGGESGFETTNHCVIVALKYTLLVQDFAELPSDPSEEIFSVFIFTEQMHAAWSTPLPVDCHTPKANLITCRNDEVEKWTCATMAELFYRVSGLLPWVSWTEGVSAVDLDFDTCSFGASFMALSASWIVAG